MSNARLQRWALVAEILGGVVVFITMILLIMQVRENTKALRGQELGDLRQMNMAGVSTTLEYSDVYVKGLRRPEELTPGELHQFNLILSSRVGTLFRFFEAHEVGLIEVEDWEKQVQVVPIYLGSPLGRIIWDQLKEDYFKTPDFIEEIEDSLESSPIVPDDEYLDRLIKTVQAELGSDSEALE